MMLITLDTLRISGGRSLPSHLLEIGLVRRSLMICAWRLISSSLLHQQGRSLVISGGFAPRSEYSVNSSEKRLQIAALFRLHVAPIATSRLASEPFYRMLQQ